MEPQRENPLCFSAVFFPASRYDEATKNQPVKIYTFNETDLKDNFVLQGFHLANLHIEKGQAGEEERKRGWNPNLPPAGSAIGYSPVGGGSYLLAGGYLGMDWRRPAHIPTRHVWSFKAPALRPPKILNDTWGISDATIHRHRIQALAVPYVDGRIFIVAGDRQLEPSLEIYDPRSASVSEPISFKDVFPHWKFRPISYFLWKDSSKPQTEPPLIMLHFEECSTKKQQLLSYNVEERRLAMFDRNFPFIGPYVHKRQLLIPLDGSNTLLITDRPYYWRVYDLSSRELTEEVELLSDLENYRARDVQYAFSRQCLDGSHIVYIFMDGYKDKSVPSQYSVPYAVVSVRKVGGKFITALESEGALGNEECGIFYIFANRGTTVAPDLLPEEAPDLGGGFSDHGCKRQRV